MNKEELLRVCIGTILANTMLILQNLDVSEADVEMLEQINVALDVSGNLLDYITVEGEK